MTTSEALDLLDQCASAHHGNRHDHVLLQEAIATLRQAIAPKPEPEPESESEESPDGD